MKKLKLPGAGTTIKYKKAKGEGAKRSRMPRVEAQMLEQPEEPMGLINGQQPGSSYEWNIARALWSYGWTFEYQVALRGGREFRGGQVLDFLVPTKPASTALSVDGGYWHSNSQKEQMYDTTLLQALRDDGRLVKNEVLHAKDAHAAEYEAARAFIFRHFGRAMT